MQKDANKKRTKVSKSNHNRKYYSLRTTIPNPICVMLNLQEGDYLVWNATYDVRTNSPKITIEKEKRSQ